MPCTIQEPGVSIAISRKNEKHQIYLRRSENEEEILPVLMKQCEIERKETENTNHQSGLALLPLQYPRRRSRDQYFRLG
jgi:hypothetical protein